MFPATQSISAQQLEFRVLDCVGPISQHPYGYYRIIVNSTNVIKYLRFRGALNALPDVQGVRLSFRTVPGGEWNCAELITAPRTHAYVIAKCSFLPLPSGAKWHPKSFDCLSIGRPISGFFDDEPLCHDKIYAAIYRRQPRLEDTQLQHQFERIDLSSMDHRSASSESDGSMFAHYTWWPSDMYGASHESKIHYLIHKRQNGLNSRLALGANGQDAYQSVTRVGDGTNFNSFNSDDRKHVPESNNGETGITPKFLGHLTENNSRIIGYVTEHITGRIAKPSDLERCRASLQRLHDMGIAYGDVSAEGFIVPDSDSSRGVILHSFGAAYETNNPRDFRYEMDNLEAALEMSALRKRREKVGNRM